ncbi:hypothetical protein BKA93DRAFT_719025, partial [Sparassis latifolia]
AYLAVTVHYITDDWELRTELLAFSELEGSHSGENTGLVLYQICSRYGILDK